MKKPALYPDTSIISAYWYDEADVPMLARRLRTRDWWEAERRHFAIWASLAVERELRAGRYSRQRECLRMVRRLRYVPLTRDAEELADRLAVTGIIPESKPIDALQLAICVVNEIDYLISWNYAHLANPIVQVQLVRLCEKEGLRAPLLVSPESIPQVRLGQDIRRRS